MTTELHDVYVSRELAILLKQAGFDWKCRGYFDNIEFHPNGSVECTNYNSDTCKYLKAPTLDVAQKWLRDVKGIAVNVMSSIIIDIGYKWYLRLVDMNQMDIWYENRYETYEEAQEAGIKTALKMILENDNKQI